VTTFTAIFVLVLVVVSLGTYLWMFAACLLNAMKPTPRPGKRDRK